jgi:hypothetical protein
MPLPTINVECHREYITTLFLKNKMKKQDICDKLLQEFGIHISLCTLEK